MATASTAHFNLEITAAPDVMDFHTDNGSGFGDGDGDIDLDLGSPGQQDDDLSIQDAATDTGLEVQTASGDHDDFMVDNENDIDNQIINYDDEDLVVVDTDQHSAHQPETAEQEMANNDDDLIDYSDEEEEQTMWNESEHLDNPAEVETKEKLLLEPEHRDQTIVEEPSQPVDAAAQEEPFQYHKDDPAQEELFQEHENGAHQHSETDHEDETHANDDDFQEFNEQLHDKLEERENTATYIDQSDVEEVKENEQAYGQLDVPSNVHDDTTLNEHANLVQQDLHIHPVTVNYDSAELWLFKYHDYENSGDFLVEDESLASKPLSSLLDACRVALGSDVTDDMELGFRLDNFHNIELYQEHSSCAFISLEHLVSLYQQLHVQDGVSSPESFYMTLLFRPRVSALLNELSKAAAEGIGHVGLDRAISAGLTAFNAHLSHNSTEHDPEDWENDQEQHEEDVHDDHDVGKQAEQVVDDGHSGEVHEGSYDGHDEECHPEQDEESHVKEDSHPQVQSPAKPTPPEVATSVNETSTAAQVLNVGAIAQSPADRAHSNSAHVSPTSHDDEDDLIDYSDDELDPEADHTGEAQDTQVSASSSTVQGDDASYDDDEVEALNNRDDLETGGDPTHGYPEDETEGHVAQHGDPYEGFDDQTFGDGYVDGIEQEHELEFVDGEGLDEYPTEYPTETNDEYTNQYDDAEHEHVDQPVEFSLAEFEGNSSHPLDRSNPVEDNSAGADDFLDFHTEVANGQVEPVAEEDVIEYDDDVEDGAAGQAPVPASVAAKPVDTLSSDSLELSLQRLKRTIDEVGIDVSKATKTLDAKRPRV